jgi:PIF1-like helicase/Helitron helicase-like domain at N-terminus
LQKCQQLALEYYCDIWAQNEGRFASFHALPAQQAKYRMGRKCAIEDQIQNGRNLEDASKPMLLPSSFVGSAKWYHMLYLDALTLPQRYHCPDLFVTFTCNPKWPEIQREIPRGSSARDHPDIVARVFWIKFKSMMEDIVERKIFGEVQGYVWRIEWQLRGLPHAHLLIILAKAIRSIRDIDAIVSAEVPDPSMFPELFSIVTEFQVHTPCDRDECASCRDNAKKLCKRRFPKDMARETVMMSNQFPKYRRRGRFQCTIKDRIVSDDWVVPFCPFLSLKYRAHINCEIASSLKSFKYVYKYVLKPPDSAVIAINEIQAHLSGRLLSAAESVWRLLNLPLHKEFPAVMRLHIHLPNEHTVIFDPTMDVDDIHQAAAATTSTLLQWFDLNHVDTTARTWLYSEIPEHYVWHEERWVRRRKSMQLGRIFAVSSRNQELFALRRLLTVVRGATGWEDLLLVDGHCYDTFQAACAARGMLDDDGDIIAAFNEVVSSSCSVANNRQQFALMLLNRQCKNVPQFFSIMSLHLCDDEIVNPHSCAVALWSIEAIMLSFGRSLSDSDFGVTLPPRPANMAVPSSSSIQWPVFDQDVSVSHRDEIVSSFTSEQQQALDSVLCSINDISSPNVFAVLSSAGCGKTMWVQGLTWTLRAMGHHVLNVAASALAATLLPEGCTAHSAFRIPIPTTSSSYCGVKGASREMIRQCKCICYDEVSMVGKEVAECLNRFLQDVMQNDKPFGGKVVVFLGDFKQLMPVEPGRRYPATVKDCDWWSQCQVLRFTKNFRAAAHPEFCAFLEQVGNGELSEVPVPDASRARDIDDLILKVYGDDLTASSNSRNLIMAFTLQTCSEINAACIARVPGEASLAPAHDDTRDNRHPELYTDDYLASLPLHGVPPSALPLKVGARYMVIKNYNPIVGACNGTLCELLQFTLYLCQVKIQSGIHAGRVVMLPRCACHVSRENSGLPFEFTRIQFPLILAYGASVHKSQGQSLFKIGIVVDQESFAHGQVYTALSRTSGWGSIHVITNGDEDYITNKVHRHLL